MADITVKDANGKEFSFDVSKICDITGDFGVNGEQAAGIKDYAQNGTVHPVETRFVDSAGNAVNIQQLLQDMKSGKSEITALDLEIEATHSGPNHNYCVYYEDSMAKDCASFTSPFKKPVLKNHNSYSGEPLGRIQSAWSAPSQIAEDRSAIYLKCNVTDQEAIPKFLDGRYSTVSISGTMGTVTCNICGKTILKDGRFKFCGHWRGEAYKDQMCYWGARDITYHEVSTVNTPADDFAQITKITVLTGKDSNKNKEGSDNMDGTNNTSTTTDAQKGMSSKVNDFKKNLDAMIDSLLGESSSAQRDTQQDGAQAQNTQDNTQQPGTPDNVGDNNNGNNLQEQLDTANAKISELETQLNDAQEKAKTAETEAAEAKQQCEDMKDMCLTLASANKSLTADNIIMKEKAAGILAQDKAEERKNELLAKSMKDLKAIDEGIKDSVQQPPQQQRQMPHADNPSLADRSEDNGKQHDNNDTHDSGNDKQKHNVNDYVNEIISKLYK